MYDRRGEGRQQIACLIDYFAPLGEAGVLVPIELINERIALARSKGRKRSVARKRAFDAQDG
jgi:hypothetical protein